jgi:PilZ domain
VTLVSADRRRSPRIQIVGRLHGHVAALRVAVAVREISLSGMSLETDFRFPIDAVHEFRLAMGDGTAATVTGRVVYSREAGEAGVPKFLTGVAFVEGSDSDDASPVGDIIETLH